MMASTVDSTDVGPIVGSTVEFSECIAASTKVTGFWYIRRSIVVLLSIMRWELLISLFGILHLL